MKSRVWRFVSLKRAGARYGWDTRPGVYFVEWWEKEGRAPIACEISVTTSAEHELDNAQKCLAAGFENVFLLAPDREALKLVRERAAGILNSRQMKQVRFVLPEQIFSAVSVLESRPAAPAPVTPQGNDDEVLTAKEVGALVRLDVNTIYSYVQQGKIPYIKVQANLCFLRSEVLGWFKEHGGHGDASAKRKKQRGIVGFDGR